MDTRADEAGRGLGGRQPVAGSSTRRRRPVERGPVGALKVEEVALSSRCLAEHGLPAVRVTSRPVRCARPAPSGRGRVRHAGRGEPPAARRAREPALPRSVPPSPCTRTMPDLARALFTLSAIDPDAGRRGQRRWRTGAGPGWTRLARCARRRAGLPATRAVRRGGDREPVDGHHELPGLRRALPRERPPGRDVVADRLVALSERARSVEGTSRPSRVATARPSSARTRRPEPARFELEPVGVTAMQAASMSPSLRSSSSTGRA